MADFTDLTFLPYDHLLLSLPDDVTAFADLVAPVATLVSPPVGNISPSATIVLDVEDDRLIKRTTIWVEYPSTTGARSEVIYARGVFQPGYSACTRETLIEGRKHRFSLRRDGGWLGPPYVWVEGTDAGGNVS